MRDQHKTKERLIDELKEMRQRVSAMEVAESHLLGTEKASKRERRKVSVTL